MELGIFFGRIKLFRLGSYYNTLYGDFVTWGSVSYYYDGLQSNIKKITKIKRQNSEVGTTTT